MDYVNHNKEQHGGKKGQKHKAAQDSSSNPIDEHQYTRLAAIRSCCKRITKFIRACDLQFMQALLECVRNSAQQLVDFIVSDPSQRCLAVDFIVDHFEPSSQTFYDQISRAWAELSSTTSKIERFLYSRAFSIYTRESLAKLAKIREIELTQKFTDILEKDAKYKSIISQLEPNVNRVYDELTEITKTLKPYPPISSNRRISKTDLIA